MADLELTYAHLSDRDSPARQANRKTRQDHIAEIFAAQERENVDREAWNTPVFVDDQIAKGGRRW